MLRVPSRSDRDAACLRIDEQIRALKEERNQMALVLHLPHEILSIIFEYASQFCYKGSIRRWTELTQLTQVSRKWRSIALAIPRLWAHIIFASPLIVEETLRRSKAFPLVVKVDHERIVDGLLPSTCTRLLDTERLQELNLKLPTASLDRFLSFAPQAAAPRLRSLSLSYPDHDHTHPPKILCIPMPCLRHLKLWNCEIPWDLMRNCLSHELVFLHLYYPITKPSARQFYDLLYRCANLEVLNLEAALPNTSPDEAYTVTLSKLTSCHLTASTSRQCLAFQMHTAYPVDTATIRILPVDTGYVPPGILADLVSSCGTSSPNPRRTHMFLHWFGTNPSITLSAALSTSPCDPECPPSVVVSCKSVGEGAFLDLISIVGLQAISILLERHFQEALYPSEDWLKFLQRHTEVTRLHVYGASVESMIAALMSTADASASRLPLPNLTAVVLDSPVRPDDNPGLVCEMLYECMSKRRDCGSPIQRLELINFHGIDREMVDALETEVEEVVWDRKRF